MGLQQLLDEGRLERRHTSKDEIQSLLMVAERNLGDAMVEQLSVDGRFNCAYEAVLLFSTIPIRCAGFRTRGEGHHSTIFDSLSEIMGEETQPHTRYFQTCRKIRNLSSYSRSGIVSLREVKELINKCQEFRMTVNDWLQKNYPEYS